MCCARGLSWVDLTVSRPAARHRDRGRPAAADARRSSIRDRRRVSRRSSSGCRQQGLRLERRHRSAADAHPSRSRRRDRHDRPPLSAHQGGRARARRAAHGGSREAARERDAAVRRPDGRRCGVSSRRCPQRNMTWSRRRRADRRRRPDLRGRLHARPCVAPRQLLRSRRAASRSSAIPAASASTADTCCRRRRRRTSTSRRGGTAWRASKRGRRQTIFLTHFGPVDTRAAAPADADRRTSTRWRASCARGGQSPGRTRSRADRFAEDAQARTAAADDRGAARLVPRGRAARAALARTGAVLEEEVSRRLRSGTPADYLVRASSRPRGCRVRDDAVAALGSISSRSA